LRRCFGRGFKLLRHRTLTILGTVNIYPIERLYFYGLTAMLPVAHFLEQRQDCGTRATVSFLGLPKPTCQEGRSA